LARPKFAGGGLAWQLARRVHAEDPQQKTSRPAICFGFPAAQRIDRRDKVVSPASAMFDSLISYMI
jgi:hypothetical protein